MQIHQAAIGNLQHSPQDKTPLPQKQWNAALVSPCLSQLVKIGEQHTFYQIHKICTNPFQLFKMPNNSNVKSDSTSSIFLTRVQCLLLHELLIWRNLTVRKLTEVHQMKAMLLKCSFSTNLNAGCSQLMRIFMHLLNKSKKCRRFKEISQPCYYLTFLQMKCSSYLHFN